MKRVYIQLGLILTILFGIITSAYAAETQYPAQYDLRNVNGKSYITSVKDQGLWGTCWSFASSAAAESNAMKKGDVSPDFSERGLAWFATRLQKLQGAPDSTYEGDLTIAYNQSQAPAGVGWQTYAAFNNGGNPNYPISQFSSWIGNLKDEQAPYTNDEGIMVEGSLGPEPSMEGTWSLPYNMIYNENIHLNNGFIISASDGKVDWEEGAILNPDPENFTKTIKENIMTYGAGMLVMPDSYVPPVFNPETNAYYNANTVFDGGHAITIAGWDDNYSAENFIDTPQADGAWLIKNSWSSKWGIDGYYYLSYYDPSIDRVAFFDVETANSGFSYDNNYQYDLLGVRQDSVTNIVNSNLLNLFEETGLHSGDLKYANVFTAKNDELLKAISCFNKFDSPSNFTSYVYILNENYKNPTDGKLVATVNSSTNYFGFYTAELTKPVNLPAGTIFSVVQEMNVIQDNQSIPMIGFEFGTEKPIASELQGPQGQTIGFNLTAPTASVLEGETFLYNANNTLGPTGWSDVTSIKNESLLRVVMLTPALNEEGYQENYSQVGNASIKAFTVNVNPDQPSQPLPPEVEEINITADNDILSTIPGNINQTKLTATFDPENAHVDIDSLTWYALPENMVDIEYDGVNATVTALQEGEVAIFCDNVRTFGFTTLKITNAGIVYDGISLGSDKDPDYFSVVAKNVRPNPSLTTQSPVEKVSIFDWSEANMSDINAKVAERIPGTNDYIVKNIPINDTHINNYFLDADNITVHIYGSTEKSDYFLGAANYNWRDVFQGNGEHSRIAFITYGQNVGFVRPTVFNGDSSGILDIENSNHLEGLRVSAGVDGIFANTKVYATEKGWLPEVGDGVYAGTMGENRPIQALQLSLSGTNYDLLVNQYGYDIRVNYRVYLSDKGWTEWVSNGDTAGDITGNSVIQAVEVNFEVIPPIQN